MPPTRHWIAALYLLIAIFATWQRGVASREHTTFAIFRQSYVHLRAHSDLYAIYAAEHGAASQDRFKYSPSAAMLFAPLSKLPYPAALLLWNLLNAGLLYYAVIRVLPRRPADAALALLIPEVFTSVQASSSNGVIAALMLLAGFWIFRGQNLRAAFAVAIGTAIKIFPIALISAAFIGRRRIQFSAALAMSGIALILLPLLVVDPFELSRQYQSWQQIEISDALDLDFGMSLIRALRPIVLERYPNWAFQLIGMVLLLQPLARRSQWRHRASQLRFLCSLLIFVVLFNHQAERQSMVIAATGVALWLVVTPFSLPLAANYLWALSGASVIPYGIFWLLIQVDLHGWTWRHLSVRIESVISKPLARVITCVTCGGLTSVIRLQCAECRTWLPAWSWSRIPSLALRLLLFVAVGDELTPGHLLFRWNLWDLVR